MWPFKPKMEIGEFCGDFYNSRVFRPMVSLQKDAPLVWDSAFKSIEDVDYAISQADQQSFITEFNALKIELFGLAWTHTLRQEEYLVRETIFTRKYLDDMKRQEIWDAMANYNQAIAASAQELDDRSNERERVVVRLVNNGLEEAAAKRVVNRSGTDQSWEQRNTIVRLGDAFQRGLGVTLQDSGRATLEQLIEELYPESTEGHRWTA